MNAILAALVGVFALSNVYAADDKDTPETLLAKKYGDEKLATVVVDSAPGTVSAMSMLGIASDQTTVVQNPRNLTLALKAFDGKNAIGLSFTPARTSLMPMNISSYNDSSLARIWGNTTFSFAQGRASVNGKDFDRRAIAVESSIFLFPHEDDPFVMYWDALAAAASAPQDTSNDCLIMRATQPAGPPAQPQPGGIPTPPIGGATVTLGPGESIDMPIDADANKAISALAAKCRDKVSKDARWNASRVWLSWAGGQYQLADGGVTHSVGKTVVLGLTWGFGGAKAKTASSITVSGKRTTDSPVAKTMADAQPQFGNSTLLQFRFAIGSPTLRGVLEGSNVKNSNPTAADRTYKRSLGLDIKIADEMWINIRGGRQRRVDNNGDENGSSFTLSYSPKALLSL